MTHSVSLRSSQVHINRPAIGLPFTRDRAIFGS
jgi:hypothetical protein